MSTVNRNTRGGKSYKKNKSGNIRRKSKNPDLPVDTTTGIDFYAVVLKRLGDNRIQVKLDNGAEVQAAIPGRFRRKVWFNAGDYVQVQHVGEHYYDLIQKIINQNELAKAQTAIGKKENTSEDIFMPQIQEDDENDDLNENESEKEDNTLDTDDLEQLIDNKLNQNQNQNQNQNSNSNQNQNQNSNEDVKLNKTTINIDKFKRKQKEKERDISRRNNTREYDFKPDSLIEKSGSDLDSDSD
jgi:initiation factor 1A